MNKEQPKLKFQLDILDFENEKEIIDTIKTLLKLSKDREFVQSVLWKNGEKVKGKISPNISFVFSGCDCD